MDVDFAEFFRQATGKPEDRPFEYQCRLACGERGARSDAEWLASDTACRSLLVNVPTGLGKTAAVVLAWVWNRVERRRPDWPRRLVYCLPMRVLVEQTRDNAFLWLQNLNFLAKRLEFEDHDGRNSPRSYKRDLGAPGSVAVHVLMGGEDEGDWDLHPERPAVIIGTQDMMLSRALNRGYAASRARWPMHYGLLNNDCVWVFDEVQLMGPGLATTTQLEAFRNSLGSRNGHGCHSIWMSATLQRDWLMTTDFRDLAVGLSSLELTDEDHKHKQVDKRWGAQKRLRKADGVIGDARGLASEVLAAHKPATRTIVVVNTVRRACDVFKALRSLRPTLRTPKRSRGRAKEVGVQEGTTTQSVSEPSIVLLHSRFRPPERASAAAAALTDPAPGGTIVVSTQVIEAGVDVSAATLFTELAPWASLVQRFGRCNRRGELNDVAEIRWMDAPAEDTDAMAAAVPYALADLRQSAARLRSLSEVGLALLPKVELPFEPTHVIRRKDLTDLFDTTADLAGNDIDIDRFVRDVEESDVRVFWREWDQPRGYEPPPEDEPAPRYEELCAVPIRGFREFAQGEERNSKVWRWNFLDGKWERVDSRRTAPGQVFLVHAGTGGYTKDRGWDPTVRGRVDPVAADRTAEPADKTDADSGSRIGVWQTIAEHTDEVCRELDAIVRKLGGDFPEAAALRQAARWHDRGKAHEVFQDAVDDGQQVQWRERTVQRRERPNSWRGCRFVAKAPQKLKDRSGTVVDPGFWQPYGRKHFRHELASALAVLDPRNKRVPDDLRDLIAYLVAAHHGKVRLSIRSLPGEIKPRDREGDPQSSRRFARGVWDGDLLQETDLGGGAIAPVAVVSLEPMELGLCEDEPFAGAPSWAERMIRLRESLGPFTLAYLEAILRAADWRASRAADKRAAEAAGEKETRNA